MSTIKVDTIATRTGSGNITLSNNVASLTSAGAISGTNLTASGTLGVTGVATLSNNASVGGTLGVTGITTLSNKMNINFNGSATQAMHLKDTGGGNLASFGLYYNPSSTLIGNIQNANNAGIHLNVGNGSVCFTQTGYTAANALDDYEEGTFTPNLYHNGSNNSTFSTKTGEYTKIGNTVTCQIRIDHGNSGTAGTFLIIGGLPFAPAQANGTMSIGIWGSNPSSQVGNVMGGSNPTLYKGGSSTTSQMSFFTAMLVYKTS